MKREQFMSLVQHPDIQDSKVSQQLHEVLINYPYCQSARLLYVKSLSDQHSILYNDQLKIASAYTSDRSRLFELINSNYLTAEEDLPTSNTVSEKELKELNLEDKERVEIGEPDVIEELKIEENKHKLEEKESKNISDLKIKKVDKRIEKSDSSELSPEEIIKQRLKELGLNESSKPVFQVEDEEKNTVDKSLDDQSLANESSNFDKESVDIIEEKENDEIEAMEEEQDNLNAEIIESKLVEKEHVPIESKVDDANESELESTIESQSEISESIIMQDNRLKDQIEIDEFESENDNQSIPTDSSNKFNIDDKYSFLSWLKAIDKDGIVPTDTYNNEIETSISNEQTSDISDSIEKEKKETFESDHPKSAELIDKFIEEDPQIEPGKAEFYSAGNMAKNSVLDKGDFASETLVNIHLKQGNIQKAINMLKILSLKYPKKSAYFAGRIEEINNQNN